MPLFLTGASIEVSQHTHTHTHTVHYNEQCGIDPSPALFITMRSFGRYNPLLTHFLAVRSQEALATAFTCHAVIGEVFSLVSPSTAQKNDLMIHRGKKCVSTVWVGLL